MLKAEIERIRAGIKAGRFRNEAAVRQGVVLPLLQSLSWPTNDTEVVAPEYSVEGKRVDFALCHPPGRPLVFIEVKQVGQSDGGERQLFEYAFHQGVPMAILTDGKEWRFYLPAEQGTYPERYVYKLDIVGRDVDETVARLQRYLDYSATCRGDALKAAKDDLQNVARERLMKATLPDAWRKLLEDADELLVELIAEGVASLCGYKPNPDTVAAFLREQLRPEPPVRPPPPTPRQIGFELHGQFHAARNAREVLTGVFTELANRDATFLERFAALPKHGRTRRYLARRPDDLYPERPDLARGHSYQLRPGWWLGINVSCATIGRIIEMACEVAGLRFQVDLKPSLGQ